MPEALVNSVITGRESKALLNWTEKKKRKTQIKKTPPENNMWTNSFPIFIGGCNLSAEEPSSQSTYPHYTHRVHLPWPCEGLTVLWGTGRRLIRLPR